MEMIKLYYPQIQWTDIWESWNELFLCDNEIFLKSHLSLSEFKIQQGLNRLYYIFSNKMKVGWYLLHQKNRGHNNNAMRSQCKFIIYRVR